MSTQGASHNSGMLTYHRTRVRMKSQNASSLGRAALRTKRAEPAGGVFVAATVVCMRERLCGCPCRQSSKNTRAGSAQGVGTECAGQVCKVGGYRQAERMRPKEESVGQVGGNAGRTSVRRAGRTLVAEDAPARMEGRGATAAFLLQREEATEARAAGS